MAAALAVLDVFEEENLVASVTIGNVMRAHMLGWKARRPEVGDVRGLGAMLAIDLVRDTETKAPAPELATGVSTRRCSGV